MLVIRKSTNKTVDSIEKTDDKISVKSSNDVEVYTEIESYQ